MLTLFVLLRSFRAWLAAVLAFSLAQSLANLYLPRLMAGSQASIEEVV